MILVAVVAAVLPFIDSVPPDVRTVLGDIERFDRAITASEETIRSLARETERLVARTTLAETELASARIRYDEAYQVYRQRVRAVARLPVGTLLVLFGESRSLAEMLRATKLLRRIAMHDHATQARLDAEAQVLRAAEARADADRAALEHVATRVRETRNVLAEQRRDRLSMIQKSLAEPTERAAMQRELQMARSNLASMLARMQPTSSTKFSSLRGKLPWPVVGTLQGRFGEAFDRTLGTSTTRQGIAIRAVIGDPVQAIAEGRVAYAGWMRGYGQMVLIDHGEHYHTVVAQLERISVHAGEHVAAGAEIGRVGESGWLGGVSLTFELRKSGVAMDPVPWLRR